MNFKIIFEETYFEAYLKNLSLRVLLFWRVLAGARVRLMRKCWYPGHIVHTGDRAALDGDGDGGCTPQLIPPPTGTS